jgi:hypothetical protein
VARRERDPVHAKTLPPLMPLKDEEWRLLLVRYREACPDGASQ